jgi:hypothetical protein
MINFTGWKYYKFNDQNIGITFTHPDGKQESRSLQDPNVAKWVAEGNTPLPAENT